MRAGVRLDILIASSSGMPAFSTMVRNAPSIGAFPSPALVMMLSSNTTVPLSIHPCGVSTLPLMIWVVPPFYCWIFMQRQGWKSIGSQLEGNSNITRRIAQTISCVYLLYIQCLCNWWSCLTQLLHVNLWIDVPWFLSVLWIFNTLGRVSKCQTHFDLSWVRRIFVWSPLTFPWESFVRVPYL